MQQKIYVSASNVEIIKGIKDFEDLMYNQFDISAEVYLPIFAYLEDYIFEIKDKPDKTKKSEPELTQIKTTIFCKNSGVIDNAEKIYKLLKFKQSKIKPQVYYKIIEKIQEFVEMLDEQERTGIAEYKPRVSEEDSTKKEQQEKSINDAKENMSVSEDENELDQALKESREKQTEQNATKNEKPDFSNLKMFK